MPIRAIIAADAPLCTLSPWGPAFRASSGRRSRRDGSGSGSSLVHSDRLRYTIRARSRPRAMEHASEIAMAAPVTEAA
jgi:hypothetical protein